MYLDGNVTVIVSDLDRSVRFYTEVLGLRVRRRMGNDWAEIEAPGLTIGLHPASKHGPKPGKSESLSIGLSVDKLEPAMEQLTKRGISFSPKISEDGPVRLAFFKDLDGTPLYLCEPKIKDPFMVRQGFKPA